MKPDELERELARLAQMASSALNRLNEMSREIKDIRAVMDELVTSLDGVIEPAQVRQPTPKSATVQESGPEPGHVEVVFK